MFDRRFGAAALVGFFFFAAGTPAFPFQDTTAPANAWRLGGAYVRNAAADFKEIFSSPARWGRGDWAVFGALAGASVLLYAFDQDIYDAVQRSRTSGSLDASSVISKFGNGGYLAGLMAGLYLSGEIFENKPLRRTALLCLESFLATEAFIWAGKVVAGRARPFADEGSHRFRLFSLDNSHHSLPSGDASGAFAVATVIAAESDSAGVDALAYGLAGLAAIWRVHDRKHWPSDVFIGSALGYVVGRKVVALNGDETKSVRVSVQAGQRPSISIKFMF